MRLSPFFVVLANVTERENRENSKYLPWPKKRGGEGVRKRMLRSPGCDALLDGDGNGDGDGFILMEYGLSHPSI